MSKLPDGPSLKEGEDTYIARASRTLRSHRRRASLKEGEDTYIARASRTLRSHRRRAEGLLCRSFVSGVLQ